MDKEKLPEHKEKSGLKALSYTLTAILIVFGLILLVNFIQARALKKSYQQAKELAFEGQYTEAIESFEALGDINYQDAGAFIAYCRARRCYDEGRIFDAETDMIWASFRYLEGPEQAEIDSFEQQLDYELSGLERPEKGQYQMEFYPDAGEFFYYHGEDFKSFGECERYYLENKNGSGEGLG